MYNAPVHERRYPELDALRGVAVALMIFYHLCFDLSYFYNWNIAVGGLWWSLFARSIATLFLLIIGICFMISWSRTAPEKRRHKYLRRAGFLLIGAMLVSATTWLIAETAYVKFGILHLVGVSALIQPLFARFTYQNAIVGILIIIFGTFFAAHTPVPNPFFAFGITFPGFLSLDYYPILPWFGVILIGMYLGKVLYLPEPRMFLQRIEAHHVPAPLLWMGRRALILYFLHQPVILMILTIVLGPAGPPGATS